jgi:predicted O-methyltransferase YrrM
VCATDKATRSLEVVIPTEASWTYAEAYRPKDEPLAAAARRADEVGCPAVSDGTGATLALLARLAGARAVVELGSGAGVSGLWLLQGMRSDGVLTTVDAEAEHVRLARESFAEARIPTPRTRLITGHALEVLPRLADSAYDLVFCDASPREIGAYLEQAARLLRPGGLLAVAHALWGDRVADPAQRDPATVAVRSVGTALRDDERFAACLLPVGDGLLVAVRLD